MNRLLEEIAERATYVARKHGRSIHYPALAPNATTGLPNGELEQAAAARFEYIGLGDALRVTMQSIPDGAGAETEVSVWFGKECQFNAYIKADGSWERCSVGLNHAHEWRPVIDSLYSR